MTRDNKAALEHYRQEVWKKLGANEEGTGTGQLFANRVRDDIANATTQLGQIYQTRKQDAIEQEQNKLYLQYAVDNDMPIQKVDVIVKHLSATDEGQQKLAEMNRAGFEKAKARFGDIKDQMEIEALHASITEEPLISSPEEAQGFFGNLMSGNIMGIITGLPFFGKIAKNVFTAVQDEGFSSLLNGGYGRAQEKGELKDAAGKVATAFYTEKGSESKARAVQSGLIGGVQSEKERIASGEVATDTASEKTEEKPEKPDYAKILADGPKEAAPPPVAPGEVPPPPPTPVGHVDTPAGIAH